MIHRRFFFAVSTSLSSLIWGMRLDPGGPDSTSHILPSRQSFVPPSSPRLDEPPYPTSPLTVQVPPGSLDL
ncbi:uncharacterized protein TEOVI_000056400 [Trypanosoma equiperdum]|uniref:Secreted protein n=2 Tax=Trypanozoon TaxID=39700 RepID=Q38DQ8_TRYB2|nr:hypothetical protein, unlikely [Trypanosoma brucei brucei TREU927]EAN77062.1 hypothetical protein, unlikely [Trypanosoma brucei brucei TREU927]SCU68918.1 hypothetical protein, conserved [Trypanosoma equiperdum]